MAQAADLRAGGATWETVAARLHCAARTCRRWPKAHPEAWRRLYREASQGLLAKVGAEAMNVLRKLLRSKDEKVQRDAVRLVVVPHLKELAGGAPVEPAAAAGDAARIAAFLGSHTDAQVQALCDELLARRPALPDRSAAGGGPPARPPLPE
jgi:hypothetical protein